MSTTITRNANGNYEVSCACGFQWTMDPWETKSDAQSIASLHKFDMNKQTRCSA